MVVGNISNFKFPWVCEKNYKLLFWVCEKNYRREQKEEKKEEKRKHENSFGDIRVTCNLDYSFTGFLWCGKECRSVFTRCTGHSTALLWP